MAEAFKDRLKEAREEAGLTQYALAKRAGISKQAMNLLESGRNQPSWETVQRIAHALGLPCERFQDPALAKEAAGGEEKPKRPGRPKGGKKEKGGSA